MKKYNNGSFRAKDIGKQVTLYGWVNKKRNMGGMIFVDLRDKSGLIQLVFNKDTLKTDFNEAEKLHSEYCIKVKGIILARSDINSKIPTGEIEVIVSELEILSECELLPFNIYEENETNEHTTLKYRYLELRRERLANIIRTRAKIMTSIREYLNNKEFCEIETPILCKSTPEGARDYIVPSRIQKGSFYALPQSPQIFKQLLMLGGFERYYQIAKCFRDEDLRADRQPEFTQIDIEMSFVEEIDVRNMAEELIKKLMKDIKNIDIPKIPVITYKDAIENYGSDKPDTRFDMMLLDFTEILKNSEMILFKNIIENNGIIKGIIVKNSGYSRNDIDKLTEYTKVYGAKGLAWLKYNDNTFSGSIAKNLESNIAENIKSTYSLSDGDIILLVADETKTVHTSLGALRLKIAENLNIIDKNKFNFLWVVDFPMFEYSKTDKRWKSTHHPFTKPKNIEDIKDPENCLSDAYDMVLNGYEIGGGSIRIHDSKVQEKVFEALNISKEESRLRFGFFVDAFKYGAPPHGGLAFGLDRLVMLLCNTDNIKDVIAFPKTQSASDLMSEAPSEVSTIQLDELGIAIKGGENF